MRKKIKGKEGKGGGIKVDLISYIPDSPTLSESLSRKPGAQEFLISIMIAETSDHNTEILFDTPLSGKLGMYQEI